MSIYTQAKEEAASELKEVPQFPATITVPEELEDEAPIDGEPEPSFPKAVHSNEFIKAVDIDEVTLWLKRDVDKGGRDSKEVDPRLRPFSRLSLGRPNMLLYKRTTQR
jgi:hypothetical protein